MATWLTNARLIDGTGRPAEERAALMVDGHPLKDITVLQDRARRPVMKGGQWITRNLS